MLPEKLLNVYQSGGTLCQGIQHVQSTCGYNKQILKSKILLAGKTRCQFIFIRITCRCSHNLGFKRAYQRHRDTFPREHMQFFLADAPCGGDVGTVHACLAWPVKGFVGCALKALPLSSTCCSLPEALHADHFFISRISYG